MKNKLDKDLFIPQFRDYEGWDFSQVGARLNVPSEIDTRAVSVWHSEARRRGTPQIALIGNSYCARYLQTELTRGKIEGIEERIMRKDAGIIPNNPVSLLISLIQAVSPRPLIPWLCGCNWGSEVYESWLFCVSWRIYLNFCCQMHRLAWGMSTS